MKHLDAVVWADLCDLLRHPASIRQALQRAHSGEWLPHELQARREGQRKARVTLGHQIDRLTEAYLEHIVTLQEYRRRRRELEERQEAIETQMRELEATIDRQGEVTTLAQGIESFCQRIQHGLAHATFDERRHLVELLIDRVIVTQDEVEIRYVIPTSPRGESARFYQLRLDYCRTISSFAW
jgi:site-specific DNA recombinase